MAEAADQACGREDAEVGQRAPAGSAGGRRATPASGSRSRRRRPARPSIRPPGPRRRCPSPPPPAHDHDGGLMAPSRQPHQSLSGLKHSEVASVAPKTEDRLQQTEPRPPTTGWPSAARLLNDAQMDAGRFPPFPLPSSAGPGGGRTHRPSQNQLPEALGRPRPPAPPAVGHQVGRRPSSSVSAPPSPPGSRRRRLRLARREQMIKQQTASRSWIDPPRGAALVLNRPCPDRRRSWRRPVPSMPESGPSRPATAPGSAAAARPCGSARPHRPLSYKQQDPTTRWALSTRSIVGDDDGTHSS